MNRRVVGIIVVVALLAIGAYVWKGRGSSKPATAGKPVKTSPVDLLKNKPKKNRWAPPICRPSGVVRTPDGKPAPDAIVAIQAAPLAARLLVGSDTPDVKADAQGKYVLPATAPGAWLLVAAVPKHRAGVRQMTISDAGDCADQDITLGPPGHAVTGAITDVSGGPVEGALVVVRPAMAPKGTPVGFAMTKQDGRYELAVESGDYGVTVRHPEYVDVEGQFAVRGPTTYDARMTPGAAVRGVVLTRDGKQPVPGARVMLRGGRASGALGGLVRETVADDDGKFVLTGLGSGRAWVSATGPSHSSRDPVEIALGIAESREDIEVLVDPSRRIRGIVMHDGKPAPDAIVYAYPHANIDMSGADERMELVAMTGGESQLITETDADGVFEIWGLAPGVYEVSANGPHAQPSAAVKADATRADVDGISLDLPEGITIRGRVDPPQVASVSLGGGMAFETMDRWSAAGEVKTGADGRFEIHGAYEGEQGIYANTSEGLVGEAMVNVLPTGTPEVVIPLASKGVKVAGRVVDTRGKPVANVSISSWGAVTTSDGTFRVNNVEPGSYMLALYDKDEVLTIVSPKNEFDTIEVPASGIDNLSVTVEPRERSLSGVVIGADGAPARDAWVVAVATWGDFDGDFGGEPIPDDLSRNMFDWSGNSKVALTGADGRFTIAGLRAGSYVVAAEGDKGNSRGMVRNATTDRPVRVQLTSLGSLTIAATRDAKPHSPYALQLMGPEADYRTVTSPDGKITLTGLPPGEYSITVTTEDRVGIKTFTLAQGRKDTVTIALDAWASVTGKVVDKTDGKPLAGVWMYVEGSMLSGGGSWLSDETGTFTIDRIPAGKSELVVYSGTGDGVRVPLDLLPGARRDVGTIRVDPPPPITDPIFIDDPMLDGSGSGALEEGSSAP